MSYFQWRQGILKEPPRHSALVGRSPTYPAGAHLPPVPTITTTKPVHTSSVKSSEGFVVRPTQIMCPAWNAVVEQPSWNSRRGTAVADMIRPAVTFFVK